MAGNQGRPCQSVRGGRREREREGRGRDERGHDERGREGRGREERGNTYYDWDPTAIDATSAAVPAPSHCCLLLFDNANCYHGTGTAFERQCKDPYSGPTRNVPGAPAGFTAGNFDIKAFEVFCYDRQSRN